SGSI
ncbi:hypothetical protein D030_4814B, partial [Vibrio parahaemolyticus AQ3810]